jgi:hypothetical protein
MYTFRHTHIQVILSRSCLRCLCLLGAAYWHLKVWGLFGAICPHEQHRCLCFAVGRTSPCAWNVCVTRKAPLVASDSSSSGGSDSEDDEKAAGAVEAVSTGHGPEAPRLPRTEEAAVGRCARCGRLVWGPIVYTVWLPV